MNIILPDGETKEITLEQFYTMIEMDFHVKVEPISYLQMQTIKDPRQLFTLISIFVQNTHQGGYEPDCDSCRAVVTELLNLCSLHVLGKLADNPASSLPGFSHFIKAHEEDVTNYLEGFLTVYREMFDGSHG